MKCIYEWTLYEDLVPSKIIQHIKTLYEINQPLESVVTADKIFGAITNGVNEITLTKNSTLEFKWIVLKTVEYEWKNFIDLHDETVNHQLKEIGLSVSDNEILGAIYHDKTCRIRHKNKMVKFVWSSE